MTTQPNAAPSRGEDGRTAAPEAPRQMEAAEPPRTPRAAAYPAAFGSAGGAVLFRDYASI